MDWSDSPVNATKMVSNGSLGGAGFRPSTVGVLFGWFAIEQ